VKLKQDGDGGDNGRLYGEAGGGDG
jgi:hypothetical protein